LVFNLIKYAYLAKMSEKFNLSFHPFLRFDQTCKNGHVRQLDVYDNGFAISQMSNYRTALQKNCNVAAQ
jgi:hypothetical protein